MIPENKSDELIKCPLCGKSFNGTWCFHSVGKHEIAYSIYRKDWRFYITKINNKPNGMQYFIPVWKPIYKEEDLDRYLVLL